MKDLIFLIYLAAKLCIIRNSRLWEGFSTYNTALGWILCLGTIHSVVVCADDYRDSKNYHHQDFCKLLLIYNG